MPCLSYIAEFNHMNDSQYAGQNSATRLSVTAISDSGVKIIQTYVTDCTGLQTREVCIYLL